MLGGARYFRRSNVQVEIDGEAIDVEVRQPSVEQRSSIMKAAGVRADGEVLLDQLQVAAVVNCTYFPGTEDRVFTGHDRDTLLGMPAGGWFDALAQAAIEMVNPDTEAIKKK